MHYQKKLKSGILGFKKKNDFWKKQRPLADGGRAPSPVKKEVEGKRRQDRGIKDPKLGLEIPKDEIEAQK